jgi:hypothetical protein
VDQSLGAAHLESTAEIPRLEFSAIPRATRHAFMENDMNDQPSSANATRIDPTASGSLFPVQVPQERCAAELSRSPLDEMEVPWAAHGRLLGSVKKKRRELDLGLRAKHLYVVSPDNRRQRCR